MRQIQHEKKGTPSISITKFSVNTKLKRAQYLLLKISENSKFHSKYENLFMLNTLLCKFPQPPTTTFLF